MIAAAPETFLVVLLTAIHKEVSMHVERHLGFELAKLKAQRRLPASCCPSTYGIIHHAPAISVVSHTALRLLGLLS
ncbi:hypothetical protein Plhal304r1_c035g0109541 [Plasmopara halstedii]